MESESQRTDFYASIPVRHRRRKWHVKPMILTISGIIHAWHEIVVHEHCLRLALPTNSYLNAQYLSRICHQSLPNPGPEPALYFFVAPVGGLGLSSSSTAVSGSRQVRRTCIARMQHILSKSSFIEGKCECLARPAVIAVSMHTLAWNHPQRRDSGTTTYPSLLGICAVLQ